MIQAERNFCRYLQIGLIATLTIVSAAYLLRSIWDPDFFWHMKTGAWIFEHRRLPSSDPFSYTGDAVATTAAHFTLTAYWVCQLLYHGVYTLGGWTGIVMLRFVLVAALFTVMWKRRQGATLVDTALLLVFAVAFLETTPIERPQLFSFVSFGLLLYLLDSLKNTSAARPSLARNYRVPILVSLLMMVWANVHGGYALGQATIILYLVAEGTKFAHGSLRPIKPEAYRALLVAGVAGLAASLLNPNSYHAMEFAFFAGEASGSHGLLKIQEYLSITESLMIYQDYIRVVDLALMAVVAFAIVGRPRNLDITNALLAAGTGYLAFKHARFMPVFMIVALPLAGQFLSRGAWVRFARVLASACALALVFIFSRDEHRGLLARLKSGDWVNQAEFPVKAADFVLARNLRGNMYNYYTWGGYLIWRLAPERRVFLDGRGINPDLFWQSAMVDEGFEQSGRELWKSLFEKYNISYAIIPLKKRGKPVALVNSLSRDPAWVAVFIDNYSVIFTRRTPGPREIPRQ